MELDAPREALKLAMARYAPFNLAAFRKVVVRTDSLHVYENRPIAITVWSRNQWTRRYGGAVLNVREWKSLLLEIRHMRQRYGLPVIFEWVKGKIRIIESQYLPPPRRSSRYPYEVVDADIAHNGKVWAESHEELRPGHVYSVRMNSQQQNPRIEQLLEEIEEYMTAFLNALNRIGTPATARAVTEHLEHSDQLKLSKEAVKRRLDGLLKSGRVRRTRLSGVGCPYIYELVDN